MTWRIVLENDGSTLLDYELRVVAHKYMPSGAGSNIDKDNRTLTLSSSAPVLSLVNAIHALNEQVMQAAE